MVAAPVSQVSTDCIRMITWYPATDAATIRAAMTAQATTFVAVPPPQPSSRRTVAVARVAVMARNVSQPIEISQLKTPGSFWPTTPNGARLRIIVGAEPRLPAIATRPQAANDTTTPRTVTSTACVSESPKPSTKLP